MGGEGYVLPGPNSDPENTFAGRPPIQIGGLIADAHAGYMAAIAAIGAVAVRDRSGVGQHVDISKWEAELIPNRGILDEWNNQGQETGRASPTQATMLLLPCKDGLLYITFHRDEQFERLATLLGKEEWKTDPRLATPTLRGQNRDVYISTVVEWLVDKRGEEVFHILESRGMMATYFAQASEILASEHWKALGVFAEVESSGGVRVTVPRPLYFIEDGDDGAPRAPALGEHTAAVLAEVERAKAEQAPADGVTARARPPSSLSSPPPLAGVRILDLSWIAAGPAATNLLGCLGAEMIRLESARRIDLVRFKGSIVIPGGDPERAPLFNALNFNKQGVTIDLKRPESLDIVYDLVKSCDAVIDNMRPGVMETLALGPDVLRQHNPTLVTVSASRFRAPWTPARLSRHRPYPRRLRRSQCDHRLPRRRPLHRQLPHRPAHGLDHRLRHHRGARRALPHRQGPPRRPLVGCLDHDAVRAHLHRARPIGNEPRAHRQPASLDVAPRRLP